jgi:hypothetical protein
LAFVRIRGATIIIGIRELGIEPDRLAGVSNRSVVVTFEPIRDATSGDTTSGRAKSRHENAPVKLTVDAEIAADKAREQSLGLTFGSVSGVGMIPDAPSAMDQNLVG